MKELTYKYRLLDKDCAMLYDELRGGRAFEKMVFVPNGENKARMYKTLDALMFRNELLKAPDEVFAIMKEQISNFLQAQKLSLKGFFDRPMKTISNFTYAYQNYGRKDCRDDETRADILIAKFAMAEEVWAGVREWLSDVSALYLQECIFTLGTMDRTLKFELTQIDVVFPVLSAEKKQQLIDAINGLLKSAEGWKAEANEILTKKGIVAKNETTEEDTIKFDESYYRDLLHNELGVNLDTLVEWHEAEVEKTRAEVFEIVNKLDIPDEKPTTMAGVNDLLNKYAGSFENPEILMKKAQEYLDRAAEEARKIVPLPEETCQLKGIPEQIKYSYPWGGYGGGCPIRRPLIGEYYVNDFNYTAVTDGWIKMMAIHESYPGHHVQFIRATVDTLPEVIKIGARSIPITEGTAHRSERVFEYVFAEDQFYPLFVAYRRHHTSVRIKAEMYLRYFGRPIKDAVDLYVNELGFDRATARGQVSAQESMQGYFNCYYYGMKRIEELEKKFGFDKDEYTRYLFDAGRVSLELFERFLALSPEDKHRYTHDFASIIQFGEEI